MNTVSRILSLSLTFFTVLSGCKIIWNGQHEFYTASGQKKADQKRWREALVVCDILLTPRFQEQLKNCLNNPQRQNNGGNCDSTGIGQFSEVQICADALAPDRSPQSHEFDNSDSI